MPVRDSQTEIIIKANRAALEGNIRYAKELLGKPKGSLREEELQFLRDFQEDQLKRQQAQEILQNLDSASEEQKQFLKDFQEQMGFVRPGELQLREKINKRNIEAKSERQLAKEFSEILPIADIDINPEAGGDEPRTVLERFLEKHGLESEEDARAALGPAFKRFGILLAGGGAGETIGALAGGAIGSAVPAIGTGAGALAGGALGTLAGTYGASQFNYANAQKAAIKQGLLKEDEQRYISPEAKKDSFASGLLASFFGGAIKAGGATVGLIRNSIKGGSIKEGAKAYRVAMSNTSAGAVGQALQRQGMNQPGTRALQSKIMAQAMLDDLNTEFASIPEGSSIVGGAAQKAIKTTVDRYSRLSKQAFAEADEFFENSLQDGTFGIVDMSGPYNKLVATLNKEAQRNPVVAEYLAKNGILEKIQGSLNSVRKGASDGLIKLSGLGKKRLGLTGKTAPIKPSIRLNKAGGKLVEEKFMPFDEGVDFTFEPSKVTAGDLRAAHNVTAALLDETENIVKQAPKFVRKVLTDWKASLNSGFEGSLGKEIAEEAGEETFENFGVKIPNTRDFQRYKDGYKYLAQSYKEVPSKLRTKYLGKGTNDKIDAVEAESRLFGTNREEAKKVRELIKQAVPENEYKLVQTAVRKNLYNRGIPKQRERDLVEEITPDLRKFAEAQTPEEMAALQGQGEKLTVKRLYGAIDKTPQPKGGRKLESFYSGGSVKGRLESGEGKAFQGLLENPKAEKEWASELGAYQSASGEPTTGSDFPKAIVTAGQSLGSGLAGNTPAASFQVAKALAAATAGKFTGGASRLLGDVLQSPGGPLIVPSQEFSNTLRFQGDNPVSKISGVGYAAGEGIKAPLKGLAGIFIGDQKR